MKKSILLFLFSVQLLSLNCIFSQSTNLMYTENGVFVVPDGVYSITVECIGGGGGGARASTAGRGRGGGGGGAYAKSTLSVTPGENYSIAIGLGGEGGDGLINGGNGGGGGNSIFGDNLVLAVGGGGTLNDQNPGGLGGESGLCIYNVMAYSGGNGGSGGFGPCSQCGFSGGGGGGAGTLGNGGNSIGINAGIGSPEFGGNGAPGSSGASNGQQGFNFGGGGSGGRRGETGFSRPGGSGANGVIVVSFQLCDNNFNGINVISSCTPFTWIDGITYTESNNSATFLLEGAAANGCDSLVTLNLTINNSTTGTDVITACDSYTWIDGETYTESNNTATLLLEGAAANGCDSLVTLNLTINNSATGTDIITACDSYTWIDGETYTESNNTATFNIVGGAANGCDSLVTLNLIINNSTTGIDEITACDSYTWIDGETYTESNNTATFNIVGGAANGCDSLVTLNLTITPIPAQPTVACYETVTFNSTTCSWEVSGTQPPAPTNLACWQTATFNNGTCSWDVTGTEPVEPTNLACWQTATFNNNSCSWEVSGTQTVPSFSATGPYCSGTSIPSLPTISLNGISGTWSPAINNTQTTLYTFTPNAGECASTATLTIVIENCGGNVPVNDVPCGAFNITTSGQTALNTFGFLSDMSCNNNIGNNTNANIDAIGTPCNGVQGRSVWYNFTTPLCTVNGAVPFEIELSTNNLGTNFNTKVYLFAAQNNNGCSDLIQLSCNDDHNGAGYPALCGAGGAATSTIVATNLLPNTQYWVKVDGLNVADAGNFVLSGRAVAPAHTTTVTGGGTQLQLTTQNMGAGLYTYYYKQVGSTGHSTSNSATALTNVRTLSPGFNYQTQIMYRCGSNTQASQFYRTAPQTIALESTCAEVNDMTCAFNGNNSYTLSWAQPMGDLYTYGGLSGYRIKRNPVGSTGVYTFSNPAVVCVDGTCSVTLTGNSPTGFNWTIETRCSANNVQVGNTTSCGPAPEMPLGNDASNDVNRTMNNGRVIVQQPKTYSFVNAEAGIEFVDVQMHDAYAEFGLNTPMIGDYEIYVNDNNEINWRRVETAINTNFDFVIVPNPSNAITTVHLNTVVEAGTFTIVDAMGRTINSGAINNTDKVNIDAAQLQSGVYMVVVIVEGVQMTKRLVVAD
jgi:hypothetical protein